jgi:hypothetical protein
METEINVTVSADAVNLTVSRAASDVLVSAVSSIAVDVERETLNVEIS